MQNLSFELCSDEQLTILECLRWGYRKIVVDVFFLAHLYKAQRAGDECVVFNSFKQFFR